MSRIEELLREKIGLDADSIGSTAIQRTVRLRMKALGIAAAEDYQKLLEKSQAEWAELMEAIVVTETWFFRDREPFNAFVRLVREQWLPGYVLCPAVRSAVRFFEGNILSATFLPGRATYDIVFCRNLLIYFDRQTQRKALNAISRLLAPSGVLIVGAAEQPLAFENGFVSANIPMAFACRKKSPTPGRPTVYSHPARFLHLPPLPASMPNKLPKSSLAGPQRMAFPQPQPAGSDFNAGSRSISEARPPGTGRGPEYKAASEPRPDLSQAHRLADEGKFKEAAAICQAHIRLDAASAQAWYLLGLVRDAAEDPLAVECYRKALYLDPNHYETLLQMALLSEKCGDSTRARTFRQRAARTKPRSGITSEHARV